MALTAASIFLLLEAANIRFGFGIPHFGIVSEIINTAIVLVIPWGGWVFLLLLIVGLCVRLHPMLMLFMYFLTAMLVGIGDTVISFEYVYAARIVMSIFHYLVMYLSLPSYLWSG